MKKPNIPVRFTGQHFTTDKKLITDAITFAELDKNATVLDIGAGKGYLTKPLAEICNKVIAIEKDRSLAAVLKRRFSGSKNVDIIVCDFRNCKLPAEPFRVVSNIPYGITSQISETLMYHHAENFRGGTLVIQLEAARKMVSNTIFNPYVIFYRTFFELKLLYEVAPGSFTPPPTVMSALLRIRKKERPEIPVLMKKEYLAFLSFFLKFPHLPVRTALKQVFRKRQVSHISEKYKIDPDKKVTRLSATEWACCFNELLVNVPEMYHPKLS